MASIEVIFEEALKLPPDERVPFVEKSCGDDREKLEKLLGLLRDGEGAADLFDTVRIDETSSSSDREGTVIDRYKLLQQIGEGGFGTVFMAEQREPVVRRVALKIIKAGLDTREVVARFEAERQALAMMDHPCIAKVLDAGATGSGRPYFAMELVKGVPVTDYCDRERLDIEARLDLFTQICNAVQHAHQKGVIHRDLKPSNILVALEDGAAVPKVIDFGVAKATQQRLTEKTLFTQGGMFLGTPVYASPEQAELTGLDIDTRSDVYSLGVLLYELLTGKPPIDAERLRSAGYDEMRRIIREEEPPKPSARITAMGPKDLETTATVRRTDSRHIGKAVKGDLDWIVMKALEKQRERRYETASAFAIDIRRYLDNEPVSAAAPSAIYRFEKFVKRYRGAVAGASLAVFAVLSGLGVATWKYFDEKKAKLGEKAAKEEARLALGRVARSDARSRQLVSSLLRDKIVDLFLKHSPRSAAAVVAEVSERRILSAALVERDGEGLVVRDDALDRIGAVTIEPGSTLAPIVAALALEYGTIEEESVIHCGNGISTVGGRQIRDHHAYGELGLLDIIAKSSNIGIAKVADQIGDDGLRVGLLRFGFGSRTGWAKGGEDGETSGILPSKRHGLWSANGGAAMIATGYGLAATPLQLVRAYLILASPRPGDPIGEQTAAVIRRALKRVVSPTGTGSRAISDLVELAGKSGTAVFLDPSDGNYIQGKYVSSFIGLVPADNPEFVVIVTVEAPETEKAFGGVVAGPVFREIAELLIPTP